MTKQLYWIEQEEIAVITFIHKSHNLITLQYAGGRTYTCSLRFFKSSPAIIRLRANQHWPELLELLT